MAERTEWRRYSEFHALNELIGHLYPGLRAQLVFPSKKTFGNTQRDVLERRRGLLHAYLQASAAAAQITASDWIGNEEEGKKALPPFAASSRRRRRRR